MSSVGGTTRRTRQKRETREKILRSASRLFRRDGFAATGVDRVMSGAGLTAGGFYAHFRSKDQLLADCLRRAFAESWARLQAGVAGSPAQRRRQLLARYLSPLHRDCAEWACPLVSLAAELGRHGATPRRLTARYLEDLIQELERLGLTRPRAIARLSQAVGALLLASLVRGNDLSDEILNAART